MYNSENNRPYNSSSRDGYNNNRGSYGAPHRDSRSRNDPIPPITPLVLPEAYLEQAEQLMQAQNLKITTSKIRRLYSLLTEIYDEERLRTEEQLLDSSIAAVGMMRVRIAYEAGRDNAVKEFVQRAKLLEYLKGLGTSRQSFMKLTQYMEALVAYHKYFGGKEN